MKYYLKKLLLTLMILLSFSLFACSKNNSIDSTENISTEENSSNYVEENNSNDNSENVPTVSDEANSNLTKEKNISKTINNNSNKKISLEEALEIVKSYAVKNNLYKKGSKIYEAPSNKFAKKLNIDNVKEKYYVFFLEWQEGGTKVYLVDKTNGNIFDYSVEGKITPVE